MPLIIDELPIRPDDLAALAEAFAVTHDETFGYRSDGEDLQFVSLKVVAQGIPDAPRLPDRIALKREDKSSSDTRQAYFGPEHGWMETPIATRAELDDSPRQGPLIVEEYDCTTVVRPGWSASLDSWNNIVIDRAT